MKKIILCIFVFFSLSMSQQKSIKLVYPNLHQDWDKMLQEHVVGDLVDYRGFNTSEDRLDKYIVKLDHISRSEKFSELSEKESLAFYINLYNAYTIRLILDYPKIKSIREIKSPWDKKIVIVGGKKISLNDVEHNIIRKEYNEPRIHFALVCASIGCPALKPYAFVAEKLEKQLATATRDFLADETKNRFSKEKSYISKIFKWYYTDFKDLPKFLKIYAPKSYSTDAMMKFQDYDWDLNSI